MMEYKRIPRHIGIIPDGNRRWAQAHGYDKQAGYEYGIEPGVSVYKACREWGVKELTFYGFTVDNTKRPAEQKAAFQKACVAAVSALCAYDAELLVVGNTQSPAFPAELLPLANKPVVFGQGGLRINFLVNYSWSWDLNYALRQPSDTEKAGHDLLKNIASREISRLDLIVRWGGRRRLSGFLPVQSIYAAFFVVEDYWPDFRREHLQEALDWYQKQDVTLGG